MLSLCFANCRGGEGVNLWLTTCHGHMCLWLFTCWYYHTFLDFFILSLSSPSPIPLSIYLGLFLNNNSSNFFLGPDKSCESSFEYYLSGFLQIDFHFFWNFNKSTCLHTPTASLFLSCFSFCDCHPWVLLDSLTNQLLLVQINITSPPKLHLCQHPTVSAQPLSLHLRISWSTTHTIIEQAVLITVPHSPTCLCVHQLIESQICHICSPPHWTST